MKKMKLERGGKPVEVRAGKPSKQEFDPLENEQIKPLAESAKPVTPKAAHTDVGFKTLSFPLVLPNQGRLDGAQKANGPRKFKSKY